MIDELKYLMFILYALIIIMALFFYIWVNKKREEKIKKLQTDLKSKIKKKFELTSQDISLIGNAYGLSPSSSRLALYRVYKDIDNNEEFLLLKKLVTAIQKEEPFDTMPDEVKPSLFRILELTSISSSETDKHILTPITNALTKYQELVEDRNKTKKQTNAAYTLTIVSFFIGAISLYFAVSTPSAEEIASKLNELHSINK